MSVKFGSAPKTFAVTVTVTAARILAKSTTDQDRPRAPGGLVLYNNGSATIYIGGSDVTTANGYPIPAGGQLSLGVDEAARIYAVVAAATHELRCLYLQ